MATSNKGRNAQSVVTVPPRSQSRTRSPISDGVSPAALQCQTTFIVDMINGLDRGWRRAAHDGDSVGRDLYSKCKARFKTAQYYHDEYKDAIAKQALNMESYKTDYEKALKSATDLYQLQRDLKKQKEKLDGQVKQLAKDVRAGNGNLKEPLQAYQNAQAKLSEYRKKVAKTESYSGGSIYRSAIAGAQRALLYASNTASKTGATSNVGECLPLVLSGC